MDNLNYLHNPHDRFFKESFSRRDVVTSFIKNYLPQYINNLLDYSTMEIVKDTWIDKELSHHFSDILYRFRIMDKISYIYFLFEHKSYDDELIYFQLLRNKVKIWENYLKQNKGTKKLPHIVPVIIHQGKNRWDKSISMVSLFEEIADLRRYIPDFYAEVVDVSHIPDEEIKGEVLLRIMFLVEKYIMSTELHKKLPEILELFVKLSNNKDGIDYLEVFLRYLFTTVEAADEDIIKNELETILKTGDEFMPTIAEKWVQQGIERGIERGIEQGIQKGIEKGIEKKAVETAERMIEKGISNEDIRDITGLSINKIEELKKKSGKKE